MSPHFRCTSDTCRRMFRALSSRIVSLSGQLCLNQKCVENDMNRRPHSLSSNTAHVTALELPPSAMWKISNPESSSASRSFRYSSGQLLPKNGSGLSGFVGFGGPARLSASASFPRTTP